METITQITLAFDLYEQGGEPGFDCSAPWKTSGNHWHRLKGVREHALWGFLERHRQTKQRPRLGHLSGPVIKSTAHRLQNVFASMSWLCSRA